MIKRASAPVVLSCVLLTGVLFAGADPTPAGGGAQVNVQLGAAAEVGPAPRAQQPTTLPAHWFGPGPLHKLRIENTEAAALASLQAQGAIVRSYDYGSFTLAIVDERRFGGRAALASSGFSFRDEMSLTVFNEIVLDGERPAATLNALDPAERFGTPAGNLDASAGLYVIQFEGPVRDDWLGQLETLGATFAQYVPMNAYVVRVPDAQVFGLETFAAEQDHIQFAGNYEPAYKIHATLRQLLRDQVNAVQPVTIQLVGQDDVRAVVAEIAGMAESIESTTVVGPYVNVRARLHPVFIQTLASHPRVFQIEPRGVKRTVAVDERQDQIVAGNTNANGASGTGYLAWLAGRGFNSSQFGSFSVNVVDDATSLTGHPDLANSRIDFSLNPSNQGGTMGGHGFLNAHIVAGFNNGTGSAAEDGSGYNYGLGVAPWAHVGSTSIFGASGTSATSFESQAYGQGARISSNSWSFQSNNNPIPDYDASSQEYDFITRDAQSGTAGNQGYFVLFAAGNDGAGSNTVSTPSTAKNILTVAASENNRQTGTDGCGIPNSGANNYNDMASFSSRGPVNSSGGDGRWKPELGAPGTHIQAGIPQSNYNGSSVCNQYWPSGQTLYAWSSGTSHSTPAVAGGAALVYQWFLNQGLGAPSPAMNKAVLVMSGEYMTGSGANDTLPSNSQGTGNMNLGRAFDGTSTLRVDQTELLSATGQSYQVTGAVVDGGLPFRVALVWTDAPGPTSGAPYVNDLDLTVTFGASTYRGNVFSGANSITGGSSDTRNNTELVFLPAGTTGSFTVTVNGSSISGDGVPGNGDSTDQDFALVIYNGSSGPPPVVANFSGNPVSGLVPLTVDFADLSSGSPSSWAWSFGDGGSSTAQNPSYTYTSAGTYTVSLDIVTGGGNDNETKVGYITVSDPPPAGVADGSFEGQTPGGAPASPWSVVSGTANLINPAGGTTSDNGLPTDGTQWLEVSGTGTNNGTPPSNPGGATSPSSGGAGVSQSFNYSAGVTQLSFDAAFLRNESANSTYNDWMSVDVSDGSTWFNLYFADTTTATSGTSSKYGYAMTPVSNVLVDLATIFPASTASTVFTLTVLTANGTDGIQASVGYADNFALAGTPTGPIASFSGAPTSGTIPLAVNFTDGSTGNVTSWAWTFGDGGTSSAQSPSYSYASAGTYSVSLTVTGPGGNDTLTRNNYITANVPAPTANFSGSPTTGVAPLAVNFTDGSTGSVTSWAWTFGDGGTSSAQNPSYSYSSAGTYSVTLTATGPGGSDALTRNSYISVSEPVPVAAFSGSPTSGVAPLAVSFTDSTTGTITSWAWTFGDGGTSSAQNPSYAYTAAGTYSVTLSVTGPGGSDAVTRSNYISVGAPPPVASFSGAPTSGVAPLAVNFADSSTGTITSWAWTFGDGGVSSAQNPSYTYLGIGSYSVTLTVTGPGGSDSLTRAGYITAQDQIPVAGFSGAPTSGVTPLVVNFTNSSTGNVTSWAWDFGDGATSTAQNPSHTYNSVGSYDVSLTVTGTAGNDTLLRNGYITVSEPAPIANFSGAPTTGTAPLAVNFTDASTGIATSWAWDFGDGGTSTAQNPSYSYAAAGTYSVTLTVTGPGGSDSLLRGNYISVNTSAPTANFTGTPTTGPAPLSVNFSDSSTGNVSSWAWDFGDGGSSTAQNPSYVYVTDGTYSVTLTATGPGGSNALVRTNYIVVDPAAPGGQLYYLTFTSSTTIPGVGTVADEDVVTYDPATGSWALYFDGSDVGIGNTDIHALHVRDDGNLLMSFNTSNYALAGLIGGPGGTTVDDSDIVLFEFTSSGANTAGSFTFFFDGSDVGLTTNSEDIDGLYEFPNGTLAVSTRGKVTATGLATARDEDVLTFTPSSLGAATSGTWGLMFDGSDVGFSVNNSHELDAITINGSDLLFSTVGSYSAAGGAADDEDVSRFVGTFGTSTSGTATLILDLSAIGISTTEDVVGMDFR